MSGTSLDGLDLAYCEFDEAYGVWKYNIKATKCVDFDRDWQNQLATAHQLQGLALIALNAAFGSYIGQQVIAFLQEYDLPDPDIISSHGHTVYHHPSKGYTCQIGSGAHIAAASGIDTVNDFRSLDVALGGQAAPLVPMGDRLLFSQYEACLNLGGFSNISFEKHGQRMACDICPVNIVMNPLAERLGQPFDRDGKWAASGQILSQFLSDLNDLPVYAFQNRPSLSREWIEADVLPLIPNGADTSDILRTFTEHAAYQISRVLIDHSVTGEVLVTGGGAYNSFLMKRLREMTPMHISVPDAELVEFKEALVFALLGVLRMRGETNILRSVTGAKCDSCSGSIHLLTSCV